MTSALLFCPEFFARVKSDCFSRRQNGVQRGSLASPRCRLTPVPSSPLTAASPSRLIGIAGARARDLPDAALSWLRLRSGLLT